MAKVDIYRSSKNLLKIKNPGTNKIEIIKKLIFLEFIFLII